MTKLWKLPAREVVSLLDSRAVSTDEVIDAALARIAEVDPQLNALPTLCEDRARKRARAIAKGGTKADDAGWLAGLPVVIKDLNDVADVRTTYGSTVFADHVPQASDYTVERIEAQGGVVLGKSNTPEFGAGANTFNEVFGKTRNPWNTDYTCGGSSGGATVALASGCAWLATGSDLGGSLRTPAAFCGVVGMRPSLGRVPRGPGPDAFQSLWVEGPLARDVNDLALLLDAMSGYDPRDPLSLKAPDNPYQNAAREGKAPLRVAFSADLGFLPVDAEVAEICKGAALRLQDIGATVEEAAPDLSDASAIFQTLRAASFAGAFAPLLQSHRAKLKPDVVWNIEKGLKLTADEIGRAQRARSALYARMVAFFDTYDLLLCPTAIVPPFPIDQRYVEEVAGHRFDNYVDWLGITFAITLTNCPALSLPCGLTKSGLPVGLQMVAPPRAEWDLIAAAAAAEGVFGFCEQLPIDPKS